MRPEFLVLLVCFASQLSRAQSEPSAADAGNSEAPSSLSEDSDDGIDVPHVPGVLALSPVAAPVTVGGVNELVAPTLPTLLSAAVAASEKGTQFRVAFSPAMATDLKYVPFISESSIQLFADTAKSLTRISVSSGYNPFLSTSNASKAKILAANAENPRCLEIAEDAYDKCVVSRPKNKKACGVEVTKARLICVGTVAHDEWSRINSSPVPSVMVTGFIDLYPFGHQPSAADATVPVATEAWGGGGGQVNLSWKAKEVFQGDLWGTVKGVRSSGDPGTALALVYGGGATVAVNAVPFLTGTSLLKSDDYRQTGFIPGLVIGVSGQLFSCGGGKYCEKGRVSGLSLTPFVDVRANPKLQFRFSVPITSFEAVDVKTGTELTPTLALAGTFGSV